MIVCICNNITDREIRQAARLGARDLGALRDGLGVATQCGKCECYAQAILHEVRAETASSAACKEEATAAAR